MAKVVGIDGISESELHMQIQSGGKFVIYQYCISIVIMTFRRSSNIYFIKPGESAVTKGLPFTLLALLLDWWGIPWGPIHTIGSLITNFQGGKDVTNEIIASLVGASKANQT